MEAAYIEILPKVVPIFVLLILGYLFKKNKFIETTTVEEIKKIIVNFALPAVLFTSFLDLNIRVNFIWIVLIVILINIVMLYLGRLFASFLNRDDPYLPLIFTGFEVGMLGIPLFGTIYGLDNVKFIGWDNYYFRRNYNLFFSHREFGFISEFNYSLNINCNRI